MGCRTNEKRQTLIAFKKINVKASYYWDDHGKLILWNDGTDLPTSFVDVRVRLDRYSFIERASLVCKKDFEIQQLIIEDEYLPGDVISTEISFDPSGKMTLHCKIVVGAG